MTYKLQEKNLVVESNTLIEAHYRLSSQEQKIVLSVISLIKPSDSEFEEYQIPVKDLKMILKSKGGGSSDRIRNTIEELSTKNLSINQENGGWLVINWFSSAQRDPDTDQIRFRVSELLKPYLLGLKKKFTSYQLAHAVQLRSGYSIRIYQLLKQYQNSRAKAREFEFMALRKTLGVTDKLKRFSDFKRRVLDVAKKEISSSTDIRFSYSTKKLGRKINWIIFFIYPNKDDTKKFPDKLFEMIPGDKEREESLDICNKIFKEKGEDCLKWLIEYVNGKEYDNYGAYIRFAYEKKLYEQHLEQLKIEEEFLTEQKAKAEAKKQEQVEQETAISEEESKEIYLKSLIEDLSPEEEEELNQLAAQMLEEEAISSGKNYSLNKYKLLIKSNKKDRALKYLYPYRIKLIEGFIKEKIV